MRRPPGPRVRGRALHRKEHAALRELGVAAVRSEARVLEHAVTPPERFSIMDMSDNRFPPGWNAERVSRGLDHYESKSCRQSKMRRSRGQQVGPPRPSGEGRYLGRQI